MLRLGKMLKNCVRIFLYTSLVFASLLVSGCQNFRGPGELGNARTTDEYYEHENEEDFFDVTWPVFNGKVTQYFNSTTRNPHFGIDISAPRGSTIRAAHDGIVIYAGNGFKGYGKMVILDMDGTWSTLYSHLSKINVRNGLRVQRGQILGVIGRSGNATGIHLHFEVRKNKQPADPIRYLPAKTYVTSN